MWVSDEFGRGIYATIWTPTRTNRVASGLISPWLTEWPAIGKTRIPWISGEPAADAAMARFSGP